MVARKGKRTRTLGPATTLLRVGGWVFQKFILTDSWYIGGAFLPPPPLLWTARMPRSITESGNDDLYWTQLPKSFNMPALLALYNNRSKAKNLLDNMDPEQSLCASLVLIMMFPISCTHLRFCHLLFLPLMFPLSYAHLWCLPYLLPTYDVSHYLCSPMMYTICCAHL